MDFTATLTVCICRSSVDGSLFKLTPVFRRSRHLLWASADEKRPVAPLGQRTGTRLISLQTGVERGIKKGMRQEKKR